MPQAPRERGQRLSKAEALEQVRMQLRDKHSQPKARKAKPDNGNAAGRDRDRCITLPKHLAAYPGEPGIISSGFIWTHRVDRQASSIDAAGTKRTPIRPVYLGPVAALDPNFKYGNPGPGETDSEGDKTPGFVLGLSASRSIDYLPKDNRVLSPQGGRPKKIGGDHLIQQLAAEGQGSKAIARSLGRLGIVMSYRTVARRLAEFRIGE